MTQLSRARIAWATLGSLLLAGPACAEDATPVRFAEMMRDLSQIPDFVDGVIARLGKSPASSAMLGPFNEDRLREILRSRDWEALDRFPTMTVAGIGRAVRLSKRVMSDDADEPPTAAAASSAEIDLGAPFPGPSPRPEDFVQSMGYDVVYGDALDPEAAAHFGASERLADVLNRMALGEPDGGSGAATRVRLGDATASTSVDAISLLQDSGHRVEIRDARYFANFGDLRFRERDVLTPFWMDTEIPLPHRDGTLRVPAAHSQHELIVRGPVVNADIAFFFGVDGEAKWRSIVTRDQAWTLGRDAAVYEGERAREVVRITGAIIRFYVAAKSLHPHLPFGGYFELGVCNDVNAMIEMHMQGETSLYPLTRDVSLFPDSGEVALLARALPVDGNGADRGVLRRVIGSLPTTELASLPFPTVRADLEAILAAEARGEDWWRDERSVPWLAVLLAVAALAWARRRRAARASAAAGR